MPTSIDPCVTAAEPNRPFTMPLAASVTGESGVISNTLPVMMSPSRAMSAAPADLVQVGVLGGTGGRCEIAVQPSPQAPCPRTDLGPVTPEHLKAGVVQRRDRLVRG